MEKKALKLLKTKTLLIRAASSLDSSQGSYSNKILVLQTIYQVEMA